MEIIKVSSNEKAYLFRMLEKSKNRLKEDYCNNVITKEMYEIENKKIMTLINRVNGHYKEDLIIRKINREDFI